MLLLHIFSFYVFIAFNIKEIYSVLDKNTFGILKILIEGYEKLEKAYPKNCAELQKLGDNETGIRKIYPYQCCAKRSLNVLCDQETDGGGWTVFQHRQDVPERENFHRDWIEYKLGFGNLNSEFWLGLDNIHTLVSDTLMELRVDIEDYKGNVRWAKYDYFYIFNEGRMYKPNLGNYSGNAGDGLRRISGSMFVNPGSVFWERSKGCAVLFESFWWKSPCHSSNLNAITHVNKSTFYIDNNIWEPFGGYPFELKSTKLSIRPRFNRNY